MIEQGLYFGLGCVVAGLLALGFAPILWARALRLTRQRLQVQIPVSMQEILADRDHLRAELAVDRRKLEQEMDRVRAGKASDMGELGRRAMALATSSDQLAASRDLVSEHVATIATLHREASEMATESGGLKVALHDTHAYFEQRLETYEALKREHRLLEEAMEGRRTTIAALHTRVMGLEMTIEDADRARAAMNRQMDVGKQHAQLLTEERDLLAAELGAAQSAQEALRKRLAGETARADETHQAKLGLQSELDASRVKLRSLELELEAATQAVDEAKSREKAIYLRQSLQAEKARGAGRTTLDKLEALQGDNAALRGALDAARRRSGLADTAGFPHEPDTLAEGDAVLRASIHELGLAVAEMTRLSKGTKRSDADSRDILPPLTPAPSLGVSSLS